MVASTEVVDRYQKQYQQRKPELPGASTQRDRAMQLLAEAGFPTAKTERWRYTRLNRVLKRELPPAQKSGSEAATNDQVAEFVEQAAKALTDEQQTLLVFQGGYFRPEFSTLTESSGTVAGVEFQPLAGALEADGAQLLSPRSGVDGAFDQLNCAMVADGGVVTITEGKHPRVTLLVIGEPDRDAYWQLQVKAAEFAQAELAIVFAGLSDAAQYNSNNLIHLDLGAGAHVSLSQLQLQGGGAFHYSSLQANLQRDSKLTTHLLTLGGGLSRDDVDINLADQGAEAEVSCLQLSGGQQHADHHLTVEHAQPNCISRVSHHGLFAGRGRGVFNGRVHVHSGADGTDSEMNSANLLLSPKAEIDAKPELEIYADDVKCSHGTTVGELNRDELFYLRSRGIVEADARRLLLDAFAAASFSTLTDSWKEYVAGQVVEKLGQLSHE